MSSATKVSGPTRRELKALARLRLREANALFDAGLYDAATYLSGYVVELALKARICKLLGLANYPPPGKLQQTYRTHSLDELLLLSGLESALKAAGARNGNLLHNWSVLTEWAPEMRYQPRGTHTRQKTLQRLRALDHPSDGVLTWIARRW